MTAVILGNTWFSRVIGGGLRETLFQLLCLALPCFLFALLLAWLARVTQTRLAHRFGWHSVLLTGWLGTPIHEMSHVLFCLLFRHSVEEVSFFQPDREAGRLGYVKHGYKPGSIYQVIGNFFIGIAPLAGGALVLYGLLWFFFPGAARSALSADGLGQAFAAGQFLDSGKMFATQSFGVLRQVVTWQHVADWRLWLFFYLALCIGSHLAPSRSDYRGATWGGLLLVGLLLLANVTLLACNVAAGWLTGGIASFAGTALALLALAVMLCGCTTLLVLIATALWDVVFGARREQVSD